MADLNLNCELIYSSISSNRIENNISCKGNYLLYSRTKCPVILCKTQSDPAECLIGHQEEVNGQCFVEDASESPKRFHIISSSYDKSAIIWEAWQCEESDRIKFNILYNLQSPDGNIFMSRCSMRHGDKFVSVTTTVDGNIYVWHNDNLAQTITTKCCYFQSKLYNLLTESGSGYTFLFLAGGDNKIHIYHVRNGYLNHLFDITGHSDWVKCLDLIELDETRLGFLLASASQDYFVRVWHLKLEDNEIDKSQIRTTVSKNLPSDDETNMKYKLTSTLETVLSGHQGFVHGLCWIKKSPKSKIRLVSCSADKTIVIWQSSVTSESQDCSSKYEQSAASQGIWTELKRIGETGETNLPFLGVCTSDNDNLLHALSLKGAIHTWTLENDSFSPKTSITGHFEPVVDLCWEKSGAYLLSASLDKTCRMHAKASCDNRWHELARPQVHGHELNCIASIDFTSFATGAEEKVVRTFGSTQFFANSYIIISSNKLPKDFEKRIKDMPVHAQLPALGLSNRGSQNPYNVSDSKEVNNEWHELSHLVKQLSEIDRLESLPFEEILLQSTLWWETNKLFGHGNELHALAVDSKGCFMASTSKANRADLACIIVWECSKFRKVSTIEHHLLTITRLRFSPNDQYLLSVSRDRTWCISHKTGQLRNAYKKLFGTTKSNAIHERIIWDCCWTEDSKHFMTVSRDKTAIIWSIDELTKSHDDTGNLNIVQDSYSRKKFDTSIQAVDCRLPGWKSEAHLFAFGFEDGSVQLHLIQINPCEAGEIRYNWFHIKTLPNLHQSPIRRLAFQPKCDDEKALLASGGDDCIVNVSEISISKL